MRNTVAKLIRSIVYGPEGSSRQRSYTMGSGKKSGSVVCRSPRSVYLRAKKDYSLLSSSMRAKAVGMMRERKAEL